MKTGSTKSLHAIAVLAARMVARNQGAGQTTGWPLVGSQQAHTESATCNGPIYKVNPEVNTVFVNNLTVRLLSRNLADFQQRGSC